MAVTLFKSPPPLFRKPKNVEIPQRLGVSAVVVEPSNNFFPDTAGFSKSGYVLNVRKNASNKKFSRFSRFSLLRQDYIFGLCPMVTPN